MLANSLHGTAIRRRSIELRVRHAHRATSLYDPGAARDTDNAELPIGAQVPVGHSLTLTDEFALGIPFDRRLRAPDTGAGFCYLLFSCHNISLDHLAVLFALRCRLHIALARLLRISLS